MEEAAIEINHWCHEQATYRPSDGRTLGPEATIRSGLGRCGEESVLAVAALRAAGIPVDEGVKQSNLNHRLRHGYAMFLTRDLGLDEFSVRTLMRHKSFASTEVYLKATADDIHKIYRIAIGGLHRRLLGKEA